jgi:hypothetical protein
MGKKRLSQPPRKREGREGIASGSDARPMDELWKAWGDALEKVIQALASPLGLHPVREERMTKAQIRLSKVFFGPS